MALALLFITAGWLLANTEAGLLCWLAALALLVGACVLVRHPRRIGLFVLVSIVTFAVIPIAVNLAVMLLEWLNLIEQDEGGTEPARRTAALLPWPFHA